MLDISLPIVENNKISSTFLKCNSKLIKENYKQFELLNSDKEKFLLLEKLWKTKLKINLVPSENWKQLDFKSEKDKTFFLLKWQR